MNHLADLHIHTYYSDGSDSPAEVVENACHAGLSVIAITDHDTVAGLAEGQDAAKRWGIEVIAGIELSAEAGGRDIHILGYFLDTQSPVLSQKLQEFRESRLNRVGSMIENLKKEGVNNISLAEIQSATKADALGRPHLAAALLQKGWVANMHEAFAKYLGEDCRVYVPKQKQTPEEAIRLIREAGGVAVFAHPMITNKDELIPGFVEAGLGGIETYYPNCSQTVMEYYEGIARKHKLVTTGGSDAHGKIKANTWIGKRTIPCELVEQLRLRAKK